MNASSLGLAPTATDSAVPLPPVNRYPKTLIRGRHTGPDSAVRRSRKIEARVTGFRKFSGLRLLV